jgi:hypothetical protein
MRARVLIGSIVLLAVVCLAAWLWGGSARETAAVAETRAPLRSPPAATPERTASGTDPATDAPHRVAAKRRLGPDERERFRRRILDGLRDAPAHAPARAGESGEPDPPAPGGGITDRTGGRLGPYVAVINSDLLPLAEECYALAQENNPGLRGMLDLDVEIIADEEIGGLVETVAVGHENEIDDPTLLECIRETTLSTIFPAPEHSGREGMRLTLRFEPDPAGPQ